MSNGGNIYQGDFECAFALEWSLLDCTPSPNCGKYGDWLDFCAGLVGRKCDAFFTIFNDLRNDHDERQEALNDARDLIRPHLISLSKTYAINQRVKRNTGEGGE